jgi:hypothetical protein
VGLLLYNPIMEKELSRFGHSDCAIMLLNKNRKYITRSIKILLDHSLLYFWLVQGGLTFHLL